MPRKGNTQIRETTWRDLVIQADPEFIRDSRIVTEYEFSSPPGGNPDTHDRGFRVFCGDYTKRGGYGASSG